MILMPSDFWTPILNAFRDTLLARRTIDVLDFELFHVLDSPDEAVERILHIAMGDFGLSYAPRPKKRWFFFE